MHVAGGDFDGHRGNALDHTAWADLLASCGDAGEALKTGITAMAATRLHDILANWPEDLPRGVCHADLFPDNVYSPAMMLPALLIFILLVSTAMPMTCRSCLTHGVLKAMAVLTSPNHGNWFQDINRYGLYQRLKYQPSRLYAEGLPCGFS